MKKKIIGALLLVSMCSCNPFKASESDNAHYKIIKTASGEFDWFTSGSATAESPDFLTVKQGQVVDTICSATNLADFNVVNDTVMLYFIGAPEEYSTKISVPDRVGKLYIKIDTTVEIPEKYVHRKSFFENQE